MKKINLSAMLIYTLIICFTCLSFCFFLPNYKIQFYNYINPLFWLLLFILSFFLFRKDKVRKKYKYDFLQIVIIYVIIYLILFFLSGLIVGFSRLPFNYSFEGIIRNVWSYVLIIVFQEYIRKALINRSGKNKLLLIIITCIFAIINITNMSYGLVFNDATVIFQFIYIIFIGEFVKSAFLTYMTYKADLKVSLIYAVTLGLVTYLIPITPDLNWFLEGTFKLVLPYAIYMKFNTFYERKERIRSRKNKYSYIPVVVAIIILVPFVILVSGIFKYQLVAIASNSMYPVYSRGDAFIFEKLDNNEKDNLKENDIIAFTNGKAIILHRIIKIEYSSVGNRKYITKGDNNNYIDPGVLTNKDIIGKYKFHIKFIGYPTVWLSEFIK